LCVNGTIGGSAIFERGPDHVAEQWVRSIGTALELGVSLSANPERVILQFDEFNETTVG
jgi:hypothetical protein